MPEEQIEYQIGGNKILVSQPETPKKLEGIWMVYQDHKLVAVDDSKVINEVFAAQHQSNQLSSKQWLN